MPRYFSLSKATWFLLTLIILTISSLYLSSPPDFVDSPETTATHHHDYNPPPLPTLFEDEDPLNDPPRIPGVIIQSQGKWYNPLNSRLRVGLVFARDGLVRGWDSLHEMIESDLPAKQRKEVQRLRESHPIFELVERGKKRWEALLARQSKTLTQAVTTYTQRYGRAPPRGFDRWWRFCVENNVKIVDDYDQIDRDISPFFALSPETFRKRAKGCGEAPHSFQINLSPTSPSYTSGQRAGEWRPELLFRFLEPLAPLLTSNMTIYVSDHDLGSWLIPADQSLILAQAISQGRYLTEEELSPFETPNRRQVKGLVAACPEESLAYRNALIRLEGGRPPSSEIDEDESETTFIHDPRLTYDFCDNPKLMSESGLLSYDSERQSFLRPLFVLSKFNRNGELLVTPLDAYENSTSPAGLSHYTSWENKTIPKLFWRGSSTGDHFSARRGYDWHESHRPRLHLFANRLDGFSEVWVKRGAGHGEGERGWVREKWSNRELNHHYLDVGLTAIHQCKEEDGTCAQMREEITLAPRVDPEDAAKYKYVLDVDGNGWSSRFHRLLMSGSIVIKSTILPEWYSDWLTPWVHYVPAKTDYSDLYTIMSFFAGPPGSPPRKSKSGSKVGADTDTTAEMENHDELARWIAEGGRRFGEEHWRWVDMQAYMLRLLLEYARLQADDRAPWSYGYP